MENCWELYVVKALVWLFSKRTKPWYCVVVVSHKNGLSILQFPHVRTATFVHLFKYVTDQYISDKTRTLIQLVLSL